MRIIGFPMIVPDFQFRHGGFRIELFGKFGEVRLESLDEALDQTIALRTFLGRCDGLEPQLPRELASVCGGIAIDFPFSATR